jgi:hypothetical protein
MGKKSEPYSSRWAGCDELRGGMDASPSPHNDPMFIANRLALHPRTKASADFS